MFAPLAGRAPVRKIVDAHDRIHAGLIAWRALGRSRFPRIIRSPDAIKFDGVSMSIWPTNGR